KRRLCFRLKTACFKSLPARGGPTRAVRRERGRGGSADVQRRGSAPPGSGLRPESALPSRGGKARARAGRQRQRSTSRFRPTRLGPAARVRPPLTGREGASGGGAAAPTFNV